MNEMKAHEVERTMEQGPRNSEYYRVVADERRRTVATVLRERDETVQLSRLATAVAILDGESEETRTDIETTLHHRHLPLMEEAGVLSYDPGTKQVAPTQSALATLTF